MNIFILVEGKTERKIYPKWLAHLVPHLSKVDKPALVNQNNYCIVSANGYPFTLASLKESIEEVNDVGTFDFFIIVADTDDQSVQERELEIRNFLIRNDIKLNESTDFIIILQRCCIETWFLGNRRIYSSNSQNTELINWITHFNVSLNDPELMELPDNYKGSIGNFHKMYFKEMQNEYFKNRDTFSTDETNHLSGIVERFEQTGHIATFGNLLDFCKSLNILNN